MEILNYIDLILVALVIIIAAIVLARRGQIALLRELILILADGIDAVDLYEHLPRLTRLLVSGKTVEKLASTGSKTELK